MITPTTLARPKPGLEGDDAELAAFLARGYDHEAQMRNVGPDGEETREYPTSTRFDGDST
jgi:hypothetical protein